MGSDLDLLITLLQKLTGEDITPQLPENWNRHFVNVELHFDDGKFDKAVIF